MEHWCEMGKLLKFIRTSSILITTHNYYMYYHYDNLVWYKATTFYDKSFCKNNWRSVSYRLGLFIIKPFHILITKIYSFFLDLKSYIKQLRKLITEVHRV